MEEVVQTLAEEGVLSGARGNYRLAKAPTELHIPPTVQGVLQPVSIAYRRKRKRAAPVSHHRATVSVEPGAAGGYAAGSGTLPFPLLATA